MRLVTAIFAMFIIGLVLMANTGALPRFVTDIYLFPLGDKLGHFLLIGGLAFLLDLTALSQRPKRPRAAMAKVSAVLAALVTLEEISQILVPARSFSLLDLAGDYAGIVFFTAFAYGVHRLKSALFAREDGNEDAIPTDAPP